MRTLPALATAMLLLGGCQPGIDLPPEVAARTGAIIGGTKESAHPAVGCLVMMVGGGAGICSGTLITPRIVLTAAHCVSGSDSPTPFTFITGPDVNTGQQYPVLDFEANPAWEPDHVESHYGQQIQIGWHDVGVVVLEDAVPGIDPVPFRTESLDNMTGMYATWVGYGKTSTNQNVSYDTGIKYKAVMMIADMWPQGYINLPDTRNGSPLINTCSGDSGGPSFLKMQGVEQIAGLVSSGDQNCTQMGYSTRVDTNVDWIESMILKYDPTWTPPNCGDGTCGPGETKKLCAADCAPAPVGPVCGNGTCEDGETTENCVADCPAPVVVPVCDNGTCEDGEDCTGCPGDCGECPTPESTDPELAATTDVETPAKGQASGGCAAGMAGAAGAGAWLPMAGFLLAWARRRRS